MNLSDPVLSRCMVLFWEDHAEYVQSMILSAAPYMADTEHFAMTRYTVNLKWDEMDWI